MAEWFSQHPDLLIGAAVTLVAGVISYILQRQSKYLVIERLSDSPVAQVTRFEGKEVPEARLVRVSVRNTGSLPICPEDFEKPFWFAPEGARVFTTKVVDQSPADLGLRLKVTQGTIELDPCLFNPGDRATIEMLVSGRFDHLYWGGRVAGLRRVFADSPAKLVTSLVFLGLWLVGFLGLLLVGSIWLARRRLDSAWWWVRAISFFCLLTGAMGYILQWIVERFRASRRR